MLTLQIPNFIAQTPHLRKKAETPPKERVGQKSAIEHRLHWGFRARHTDRPCKIRRKLKAPRSAAGTREFRRNSTFTASSCSAAVMPSVRPRRWLTPEDVSIDRKAREAERDAPHHVAGLAPHSGDGHQILERRGHLALEALHQRRRHADQALGLGAEEAGRADDLLDVLGVRRRQRGRVRVLANSAGVTRLTRASVDWAERMVAARSWKGFSWSRRRAPLPCLGKLGQAFDREPGPPLGVLRLRHRLTVPGYLGRRGRARGGPAGRTPSAPRWRHSWPACAAAKDEPPLPEPELRAVTEGTAAGAGRPGRHEGALAGAAFVFPARDGSVSLHLVVDPGRPEGDGGRTGRARL